MMKMKGKLILVSGPSAAGKTTIVAEALNRLTKDHDISKIVTTTSRPPREDEVNGKDYHFVSGQEFDQKMKNGEFLETVTFSGHRYGSPLPPGQEMELGKSFIYVLELVGCKQAAKLPHDKLTVWIEPPDIKTLRARLKKRGSETESAFERRVEQSIADMEEARKIRLFDYYLVNDSFDQAVNEFVLLVKNKLEA